MDGVTGPIERQGVQNASPAVEKAGDARCGGPDGLAAIFDGAQHDSGQVLLHGSAGLKPRIVALRDQQGRAFLRHFAGVGREHRLIADERAEGHAAYLRIRIGQCLRGFARHVVPVGKAELLADGLRDEVAKGDELAERDQLPLHIIARMMPLRIEQDAGVFGNGHSKRRLPQPVACLLFRHAFVEGGAGQNRRLMVAGQIGEERQEIAVVNGVPRRGGFGPDVERWF